MAKEFAATWKELNEILKDYGSDALRCVECGMLFDEGDVIIPIPTKEVNERYPERSNKKYQRQFRHRKCKP